MKRFLSFIIALSIIASQALPATAMDMSADYLVDIGVSLYKQQRFAEALHEFHKALIINPNHETAREYAEYLASQPFDPKESKQVMKLLKKKQGAGYRVQGSEGGSRKQGTGDGVQGSGYRDQGSESVERSLDEDKLATGVLSKELPVVDSGISGVEVSEQELESQTSDRGFAPSGFISIPGVEGKRELAEDRPEETRKRILSRLESSEKEDAGIAEEQDVVFEDTKAARQRILGEWESGRQQGVPESLEPVGIDETESLLSPYETAKARPAASVKKRDKAVKNLLKQVEKEKEFAPAAKSAMTAAQEKISVQPRMVQPVAAKAALDLTEKAQSAPAVMEKEAVFVPSAAGKAAAGKQAGAAVALPPRIVNLDDALNAPSQLPFQIAINESIIAKGIGVQRFLVTQPGIVDVNKMPPDEVVITGKRIGSTVVYIWDSRGRWPLNIQCNPPRPTTPTLAEEQISEEEKAKNFRLRYDLNWSTYSSGRRLEDQERSSYAWDHTYQLLGEIPYGALDASTTISVVPDDTAMTYATVGLTRGQLLSFRDFSFRLFDFDPDFSNLAFSSGTLRGAQFYSPVGDKWDYSVFWGREGVGRYTGFSPSLDEVIDSNLAGAHINFWPTENQTYETSFFRGWGDERVQGLNPWGADIQARYKLPNNFGMGYELAHDSRTYAYRIDGDYFGDKLYWTGEFRETPEEFLSSSGLGSQAGETGLLNNLTYQQTENIEWTARLDSYRDRLFPNPNHPQAWNEDLSLSNSVRISDDMSWRTDYGFQNYMGKLSPSRYYTAGTGIYNTLRFIRPISTYLTYRYNINRNFQSTGLDYQKDQILLGMRFPIIPSLSYYLNQEYSWVTPLKTTGRGKPWAYETGLDWRRQIWESPFYGNFRMTFRDEENTESPFAFMSGQDYLEWYAEIAYRPYPDAEAFINTQVRNNWAEKDGVEKRIDINSYAGLRYLWDTGFRWEAVGVIDGYVYNDLDADGLRGKSEPPVPDAKVTVGGKAQVTNKNGYYKFKRIKANKVTVNLDTTTIPPGFVMTVPSSQSVEIKQGKKMTVDFGIATRTEISGTIFEDVDGTGQPSMRSVGLRDVVLRLPDGTTAKTDSYGRFIFRKLNPGKYKVTLDLKTLPTSYLPTVPIFKELELQEGMTGTFNIPVKRVEKKKKK